tara:strand:- start:473 stop:631 length:159 start_codon:yes stop_codon:yes gene_type:complete
MGATTILFFAFTDFNEKGVKRRGRPELSAMEVSLVLFVIINIEVQCLVEYAV